MQTRHRVARGSETVGITERAVQRRIIHDLEMDGLVKREKVGRQKSL